MIAVAMIEKMRFETAIGTAASAREQRVSGSAAAIPSPETLTNETAASASEYESSRSEKLPLSCLRQRESVPSGFSDRERYLVPAT